MTTKKTAVRAEPARAALLGAALCLALLAPGAHAGEKLEFKPAPGTRLAKTWIDSHRLALVGLTIVRGGLEQDSTEHIEFECVSRLEHVDEYRRLGDGRPLELWRRFDAVRLRADLTLDRAVDPLSGVLHASGAVAGTSVVFTWQPAIQAYGRYYDLEDAPESALADLVEDTDLRAFLPGREVSPGDEWSVSTSAARELLSPGGNVEMRFEVTPHILFARSLMMGMGGGLWHAFATPPEGAIQARFEGVREVDGRRLGIVALTIEISNDVDQTELANRMRNAIELVQGLEIEEARLKLNLRAAGELLWDLERGLPHSLAIEGEEQVASYRSIGPLAIDVPEDQRPPTVQNVRMKGLVSISLSTTSLP